MACPSQNSAARIEALIKRYSSAVCAPAILTAERGASREKLEEVAAENAATAALRRHPPSPVVDFHCTLVTRPGGSQPVFRRHLTREIFFFFQPSSLPPLTSIKVRTLCPYCLIDLSTLAPFLLNEILSKDTTDKRSIFELITKKKNVHIK